MCPETRDLVLYRWVVYLYPSPARDLPRRGAHRQGRASTVAPLEKAPHRTGGEALRAPESGRGRAPHRAGVGRTGRAGASGLARRRGDQHGMYLIGTVYNFCTPHASLRLTKTAAGGACVERTPAMAARITDHGWSVRELLSFHVPPPRWTPPKRRGRPSRALQLLVERWCS